MSESASGDLHHVAAARARFGVMFGLAAYISWGVAPLYFKEMVQRADLLEILAHRVLWSSVFLLGFVAWRGQLGAMKRLIMHDRRTLLVLVGTTMLISLNWYVFIWVHETDQVLQASLGYFINPLLSVVLGFVFLGERLTRWQLVGVIIAAVGVVIQTLATGEVPVVALLLAATFGAYGLVRKVVQVEALVGLSIETLLVAPLCIAYIAWRAQQGDSSFTRADVSTDVLLLAGGLVTALPLLWFTCAARRLRLVTVGFMQYLAPSGQFLIAVFVFGEEITVGKIVSFVFIWIALMVYSVDAWRASRRQRVKRNV